ncbi:TusA-related sulfurtransferase [Thiogranum longum]|uniref:TusA-related sulfurtransferase n=1 Tax=Thiogranum longum TaxID=1537524 RepID=A0A4V2PH19_9GAMM|nr:sulfurtransferase TusA family protein [Thiogranum longum]TCK19026.1 TusA-related sulfurtransferase [Thiogranum longum]
MTKLTGTAYPEDVATLPFVELATGSLAGILSWDELDEVWQRVGEDVGSGWYLYRSGEPPAGSTATEDEFKAHIKSLDTHLRATHERAYCGVVYVDSVTEPTLVKIFDPESLTSLCNIYGKTPLHGWVISRLKPVNLKAMEEADADFQRHEQGQFLPAVPEIMETGRHYSGEIADTLDARRMGCPLPIINTCRALKRLSSGQVLEVVTIEPGALNDIDYICRQTGGSLVALEQASFGYSFYICRT